MAISMFNEQLRRIVISGKIREEIAAQFLEQITALEYIDRTKPITIYIDTYGGSVHSALSIYDAIKICQCPIITVGIGKVMSAGTLLLAAGDKGARLLSSNTRVMIHEVSSGSIGTVSEMNRDVDEAKSLQDIYIRLLARDTGQRKAKLLSDIGKDFYMSAKEAIAYGLADRIYPTRKKKFKQIKKTVKQNKKR